MKHFLRQYKGIIAGVCARRQHVQKCQPTDTATAWLIKP
jgi:hypothetical protein